MKQPEYEITLVRQAARHRALRLAVFSSIFGNTRWLKKRDVFTSILDALDTVRSLWQKRVYELRDDNWLPTQTQIGLNHLLWCPPFGVKTTNMSMRCCNRRLVCPFCYARAYVMPLYMRMEKILYASTKPDTRHRDTLRLNPEAHFEIHDLAQEKQVKDTLAAAAGRAFAYPTGMMFSSAEAVHAVMKGLWHHRMTSAFGFPRKKGGGNEND
jgi:hypothetical protein